MSRLSKYIYNGQNCPTLALSAWGFLLAYKLTTKNYVQVIEDLFQPRDYMYQRAICAIGSAILVAATLATAQTSGSVASPTPSAPAVVNPKQQPEPVLPNAPPYPAPLTSHQKFGAFVKRTYSPYTFASAAFGATWAQMWGDWYSYGGGMQGWGKRFGATMANTEGRMVFNSFLLPVIFKQDPRYFPSYKKGFVPRAWFAGTRVLVARGDDGSRMFNYSEVLGVLFMSSLQNSYYPTRDRGFAETVNRFVGGIGSDAGANVLREFSPELKHATRKIIPKRAQKLEKRIPGPVRQMGGPGLP